MPKRPAINTSPLQRKLKRVTSVPRGSMPIVFSSGAALRPLKTSESVARNIIHDIVENDLPSGTSLPSEAVMLKKYAVSRESLREGLRLLEVQGLISLRRGPGGGPIVGTVDPANLGRISTLYYHLVGATYAELIDAWAIAEGMLAELAARNPDRDRVRAGMAPYIVEQPHLHDESKADFVQSHSDFHFVMGALADNRVLQLSLSAIGEIITHHVILNADPRDARIIIETDHRAIAKAVAAGHALKARELTQQHMYSVSDFYKGEIGPKMDDFVEWR